VKRSRVSALALMVLVAGAASLEAAAAPDRRTLEAQIDSLVLVEKKVPPDGPGCAVAVMLDGEVIFKKGYGLANLENKTPITPATAFNIGSMSKQFTAACILLLAQDGKLSLDDEIHKYLPELPDYGHPVTISHLIHHTSGISSDDGLIALSGRKFTDRLTTRDLLKLIARRRALDFVPGAEWSYSNSGYILLGEIVSRVSGKSLADFARERIFRPLGMNRTVLNDDREKVIENEAVSHMKTGDSTWTPTGERDNTCVGPNNVYSTAEDLARWDRNFRDQTVGGPHFTEQMQTRGVLKNGETLTYAFGLEVANSRGQLTVSHGGATSGFRSHMMRLPEHNFSAVCLCNSDQGAPVSTVWKTASLVLGDIFATADKAGPRADATAAPVKVTLDPALLRRYVGKYQLDDGAVVTTTLEDGVLKGRVTGQDPFGLVPETESLFHMDTAPELKVSFDAVGAAPASLLTLYQDGAKRMKRIEDEALTTEQLAAFVGEYYSDELDVIYQVELVADRLFIRTPVVDPTYRESMGITGNDPLVYDGGDTFALGIMPVACKMPVAFKRNAQGQLTGFTLDGGRVRLVRFIKK
jgi:CubicO group peptidase (beta-lactamase class C family)